jgi:putative ABC transport system ATP-binding protein
VARDLTRRYGEGDTAVEALRGVSLDVARAQLFAVMGPSGSGKSTLMHALAGLDKPTSGTVEIAGIEITGLDDARLTSLRREHIGFVFQFFNLLPMLTAEENVVLPLSIAGETPDRAWLGELLAKMGLAERRGHLPSQLSGGEQQRVAIARALVGEPSVMFADEPTARSTHAQGGPCWRSCARRSTRAGARWSWSPTIRPPPRGRTASCSWPTAGSPANCTARPPSRSPSG